MSNISIEGVKRLKILLIVLFGALVLTTISIFVVTKTIDYEKSAAQERVSVTFNKMKEQIEFNGIDDKAKAMAAQYAELFGGYSNVIVTKDTGSALYMLNNGYAVEKDQFSILADPWQSYVNDNDIGYIVDRKNNIKYSVQFGITSNISHLKERSGKNPLAKVLYERSKGMNNPVGEKVIKNTDGSSYILVSDSKIILDYAYIASKGLNLYSLYDSESQFSRYFKAVEQKELVRNWLKIVLFIIGVLFWILLTLWVASDAQRYFVKPFKWGSYYCNF